MSESLTTQAKPTTQTEPTTQAEPTRAPVINHSRTHATHATHATLTSRLATVACWTPVSLACLWIGLCVAVGPLYWKDGSIADWTGANTRYFIAATLAAAAIVAALTRIGRGHRVIPDSWRRSLFWRAWADWGRAWAADRRIARIVAAVRRVGNAAARMIVRATDRRWKIALILAIGWLWVPTTLLSAFGADVRSQAREFSWAWNQWTGMKQPYIGFFSFVPMDIYPTAHYLWPEHPTYLTDQHNIVLTLLYGGAAALSRSLTGSNDAGFVALSAVQWMVAVGCVAAAANRFLNLPWLRPAYATRPVRYGRPERPHYLTPVDFAHPERGMISSLTATKLPPMDYPNRAAGAFARAATVLFFLTCPLAVFATISITKSPLFAFAFVWWFSIWYELHMTCRDDDARDRDERDGRGLHGWVRRLRAGLRRGGRHSGMRGAVRPSARLTAAFAASTCVMLVSAKYAWYIIAAQIVLALLADRRRWRTYAVALLLPTIVIHGGVAMLISGGAIIGGDAIESRAIQLQTIARAAKLAPDMIPDSAKEKLDPLFNLDQMADAYFRQDADPVKSSGIQSKKVSYKWRTVTEADMAAFDEAWVEIVRANPIVGVDALLTECFGYFNPTDLPYVSMDYYVTSDYVQKTSMWIKDYNHDWREQVAGFARAWGSVPVLGWLTHGNLYVTLTLLVGGVEVALRRWRTLATHFPLLLLMGVMVTAPANNFERHMLPVAFVFGFVCLTFWRESRAGGIGRTDADDGPNRAAPQPWLDWTV